MKTIKRGARRFFRVFLPKVFNVFVIFSLLFQPVGSAGIWNVVFAQSVDPAGDPVPAVELTAEAPVSVEEPAEDPAPAEESEVVSAPAVELAVEEEAAPVDEEEEVAPVVLEEPIPVAEPEAILESEVVPLVVEETPVTSPEVSAETPAIESADVPAETPADESEESPVSEEPAVEEVPVTLAVPVVDEPVEVVSTEPADETICLSASVSGDSEGNWNVNEEKNTAVTNDAVQLGVRYVFPLDKEVTVTFTCLPKDEGKRAPLKIERIKSSDINLPDGTVAVSEYAYDITTNGMDNGDFKYDLSLPKSKIAGAEVKYIEQSADEVVANAVTKSELNTINKDKVKAENDSVTVSDLDHFTIFIITYADALFSVEKSEYVPGETIYVKGEGLNDEKYYRIALNPPIGSLIYLNTCFNPASGVTILTDPYLLPADAALGSWAAELKEYSTSNCTSTHTDASDAFAVVAPPEPEHVDVTICHVTPPDTAANGYQQMTIDDDGALSGHDPQHGADIIPPFDYYDGHFDGKNWDTIGQAIWNNDCVVTGTIVVHKDVQGPNGENVTDLASHPQVSLDGATGQLINENFTVTYNNVPVGSHTITESYIDPNYTLYGISTAAGQVGTPTGLVVNVAGGQTVDVYVTNRQQSGTITVVKDVVDPNGGPISDSHSFTVNLAPGTQSSSFAEGTNAVFTVNPGTYTASESADLDYTSLGCLTATGKADIFVESGGAVTITCTNKQKAGHIKINKDVLDPDGEDLPLRDTSTSFYFHVFQGDTEITNPNFPPNIQDNESVDIPVNPGNYSVAEDDPSPNYTSKGCEYVTYVDVDPADGNPDIDPQTGHKIEAGRRTPILDGIIVVGSGETVNISCTNQQNTGTIIVEKDVVPDGDAMFDFTIEGDLIETIGFVLGDGDVSDSYVLPAATYTVSEESDPFYITTVECVSDQEYIESTDSLTLDPGETITCTYTNTLNPPDTGSITIVKDANPDSAQNFGYAMNGAGFVEFVLDDDVDPLLSNTTTFTSLASGTYTVTEGLVSGWALESITCTSDIQSLSITTDPIRTIELGAGENVTCTYLNTQNASAPTCGDGEVNQETEQCDGTNGVTPGENFCTFSCKLVPIYDAGGSCSEGTEPLLVQTKFVESFMTDGIIPDPIAVSLEGGKEYLIESVGHFGYGGVPHNNTLNRADAGYASDTNWAGPNVDTVFGSPATALYRGIHSLISDMGTGTFGVVDWGSYNTSHIYAKNFTPATDTDVRFAISDWYDTWYSGDELSNFNKNQYGFRDNEGGLTINVYECQEQEPFIPPILQISKSNDSGSPENPGNVVKYTITVTAPESNTTNVEDVKVTDLPPEGFEFITGSDVASAGSLTSPYASPGVWSLGTMTPGQVVTLSYQTTISGSQDAGLYNDLAFAKGTSAIGGDVFANAPDPFVGTDVEVVLPVALANVELVNIVERDVDTKTIHKTKRVLGAATILPSTGANANTIFFALLALLGGLILLLLGKRSTWLLIKSLSKSMMKVFLFVIVAGSISFVNQSASAATGDLNVQIEQPKAVINSPEIKVGFVVLDISADDSIDVECEVAYEAGSYGEFDTYTIAAGGTSGDCDVDAADMPADGTYTFRVTAEEQGGSDTDVAIAASIELVSGTPSTPLNYSRAAGSCTVSFTTANDGLTEKIEMYRSLSSTFTADSSTFVGDVVVAPNTSGTITDPNGNCGGDYFYAIRAIALSGLGSGFVGDENVTVDHENKIKTKTDIKKVAGPVTTLGAILVTGGETPSGAVEGAATEETEETVRPSAEQEGSVLGSATEAAGAATGGIVDWIKNHPWWSLFWLAIIVLIAYFARRMYFNNYNENNQPR